MSDNPYMVLPESVGAYRDFPDHDVSRAEGALNNLNIHYVAAGKGYAEIDGQVHELQRGDALLYFPMQKQRYYSSRTEPWDVRWVHFYGRNVQEYLSDRGFHRNPLWRLRQPEGLEQAHLALLEEAEAHRMLYPARLSALTYAVICEFVQQAEPKTGAQRGGPDSRIAELLPMLQQEASRPFILEEWAERAGVSAPYFCKLFRRATGMTPMAFVTRCRLQLAKQWLLDRADARIGEIAEAAGYPSASYFNRRFYEHEGMTPGEYRRLFGQR